MFRRNVAALLCLVLCAGVVPALPAFSADARWNDSELNTLKGLKGSDFEVVKMGTVVTR